MASENTISFGATCPNDQFLQSRDVILTFACDDVNNHLETLGSDISFEYVLLSNENSSEIALQNIMEFRKHGINFVLGHDYSSHCHASLSYVNEAGMLLFSSGSSSPLLSIPSDNLFRMSPNDFSQVPAIVSSMENLGIDSVIIIHMANSWADGLVSYFESIWKKHDRSIFRKLRYSPDSRDDFRKNILELLPKDVSNTGVFFVGLSELPFILSEINSESSFWSIPWFGTDGTALMELPKQYSKLLSSIKLYSPLVSPAENQIFSELYDRFYDIQKEPLGFYQAGYYDIFWLLSLTSLSGRFNFNTFKKSLLKTCSTYFGATGLCALNNDGDRLSTSYQIWGKRYTRKRIRDSVHGVYNGITARLSWFDAVPQRLFKPRVTKPKPQGLLHQGLERNYTLDQGLLTSYAYALKYFDSNFKNTFRISCFKPHIDDWVSFPKLYEPCSDEADFSEKMNIISGFVDRINGAGILRKINNPDPHLRGTFNIIETYLIQEGIAFDKTAFKYLKDVRQLRNLLHPTHTTSSRLRKQLKKISIDEYPFDWESEFRTIISESTKCFEVLMKDIK